MCTQTDCASQINKITEVITYRHISEGDASLGHLLELALGAAKLHGPSHAAHGAATTAAAALCAPEQEEEAAKGDEGEQDVAQQRHVVACSKGKGGTRQHGKQSAGPHCRVRHTAATQPPPALNHMHGSTTAQAQPFII
jgi:hypothetical protein